MKHKRFDHRDWARVKSGVQTVTNYAGGLIVDYRAGEVVRPLTVRLREREVLILDTGFRWLHYAEPGQKHALTVQLDAQNQPLQLYVDIGETVDIDPDGIPFITDLYLDVIAVCDVLPGGTWHVTETEIIDQDELDEALHAGTITRAQYDLAWAEARAVQHALTAQAFAPLEVVRAYLTG